MKISCLNMHTCKVYQNYFYKLGGQVPHTKPKTKVHINMSANSKIGFPNFVGWLPNTKTRYNVHINRCPKGHHCTPTHQLITNVRNVSASFSIHMQPSDHWLADPFKYFHTVSNDILMNRLCIIHVCCINQLF